MRLRFKSVDFELDRLFSIMGVGPIRSVEDLTRKKADLSIRQNWTSRLPLDSNCSIDSSLGLSPLLTLRNLDLPASIIII